MLKYLLIVLLWCSLAQITCSFRNGGIYTRLVGRSFDGEPPTNSLSSIASNNGNERMSLKLGDYLSNTTNLFPTNHSSDTSVSSFASKSVSIIQYSIAQIEKQMSLWWEMVSIGRKALLLILVPTVVTQFRMLQTTVPFCIEHIMQYLHPLNIGLLIALSQSQSVSYLRNILFGIIAIGVGQMFKDSFFSGASWLPARPLEDSYALVTGASSGLGKSMAWQLFQTGYNVILVGRNETVLEDVRKEFYVDANKVKTKIAQGSLVKGSKDDVSEAVANPSSNGREIESKIESQLAPSASRSENAYYSPRIEVIPANLAHPLSSFEILKELKLRGLENKIDILIANAGQGHYGKMHQTPWSDLREQLEVNVASTVSLIRLMIPRMILRRRQLRFDGDSTSINALNNDLQAVGDKNTGGRVLVISSVAGEGPGADIATYSAAKAFLSTFALSIRRELFQEGIMVTVAKPGPLTGTKFLSRVPNMKHTPMVFKMPFFAIGVNDAARQIVQAMILGREMVCPGIFTKVQVHIISKLLPASLYAASVQRFWKPFPSFQKSSATSLALDSREGSDNSVCSPDASDISPHHPPTRSDKRSSLKKWFESFLSGDIARKAEISNPNQSSLNSPNDNVLREFETEQNETQNPENEASRLQQAEEEAEMSAFRKFSLFADFSATETQGKDRDLSPQGDVPSAHGSAFSMDVNMDNDNVANSQTNYFSSVKMVHI